MRAALIACLAAVALFIWFTGNGLPSHVAAHFDSAGNPDAFMSRGTYLALMSALAVGVPAVIALSGRWAASLPNELINLPNKDHWLAPARREASLAFVSAWLQWAAVGTAAFLGYVHWLVVRSNALTPPRLENTWLLGGLAVGGCALIAGLVVLYRRFRREA